MRLWLDDKREMPADYDVHVKTAAEAIRVLDESDVDHIGFDHDLADFGTDGTEYTGYTVAKHIESKAFLGIKRPPTWSIQSSNTSGSLNILAAMRKAHEYWDRNFS